MSEEQREKIVDVVINANEKMAQAGADRAEQSFGLGCALGALPIATAILVLFLLGIINIVLALILVVMSALALTGIATLVASFARSYGMKDVYKTTVGPEINLFLNTHKVSRDQFKEIADEVLSEDAPLRSAL
jgi:hypothetical protein